MALLLLAAPAALRAAEPPPGDAHLGVASCAGSNCHGAASRTKTKSGVVQNEYLIWQRYDKHAIAFTVLQGKRGQRIAANLGIGPADQAPVCLQCHADTVPRALQGVQFHIADGVGCESCHGGSNRWLGPHSTGLTKHATLVQEYGLYPTDQPKARATLCLSCHLGDADRFITHKIMGAGHPRLSFELQTFTQIQPAHFVIDDKYRARKMVAQGVQVWAVGQAMALQRIAEELGDPRHQGEGVFPELVFFDCQSCHHSTANLRWQKRGGTGLSPGLPHFNDANAIMLHAIALRVAPDLAASLQADVRSLHQALSTGAGRPAAPAQRIAQTAARLGDVLAAHDFSRDDMRAMIAALAQAGGAGDFSDYAAAEQATMAFASIIYTLKMDGDADGGRYAALRAALEQCYTATKTQDAYNPAVFATAAQAVLQASASW
jgi:hypothetical protein